MSYPLSANVSAGDPTLSAHYNNLRSDALLLGQPAADVVNLATLLERYESRLSLERLSTDKIRVPAAADEPVSLMLAGFMVQATANVDLADAEKPSGAAADYYIFANRIAGSTTFTLTVDTSITEAANQRLIGRFYWNGTLIVKDSVRTERAILIQQLLYFVEPQVCEGRLTLSTGEPVSTADVATSSDVFFTPYTGSRIALYAQSYGWRLYQFAELTLDISGIAAGKNIDVWIYDNAGTLTLAYTEWSNDILRATALTRQDGVLVKSGAPAYRYLGSVRLFNAGAARDTIKCREVWNYYNRVEKQFVIHDPTDSWTYAVATTWRAMNTSTNNRCTFIIGVDETLVKLSVNVIGDSSAATSFVIGIGLDVNNANHAQIVRGGYSTVECTVGSDYFGFPGIGFHFLQLVEYLSAASTITFYGDRALPDCYTSGAIGSIVS